MANDRRQPLQGASSCGRSQRKQPGHESHKRGLNTKLHLAVDAHGMPVRMFITEGTAADCTQAGELVEEIDVDYLLADRAYDMDATLGTCARQGIEAVIPAKRHRQHV